ncbi:MAG: ParB N-terminal domain-containing protein [Pseudomonadota bacterium]
MTKRRVFDIDFPEAEQEPLATADQPAIQRRGPMATAIAENAGAVQERRAAEAAIRAENDALAHEHVRLKKLGLIVDRIPLDQIRADKLTRDRFGKRDPEIDELKTSIASVGLSNAIRVEQTDTGYELVQGFRRLQAYRELLEETGDAETYGGIPAGLVARGETTDALYRRMVDENLVRKDVSFAEMAQLAAAYADDPETEAATVDAAVDTLFASAGRQKRVYIRRFAALLFRIGSHLDHAEAIPRALGLTLIKRIERIPGTAAQIQRAMAENPARTAELELEILGQFAGAPVVEGALGEPQLDTADRPKKQGSAKTVFKIARPEGLAKCTATDGRLELRMNRDFSGEERHRLEAAVEAFFAKLDP